jgi:hypothetical protein
VCRPLYCYVLCSVSVALYVSRGDPSKPREKLNHRHSCTSWNTWLPNSTAARTPKASTQQPGTHPIEGFTEGTGIKGTEQQKLWQCRFCGWALGLLQSATTSGRLRMRRAIPPHHPYACFRLHQLPCNVSGGHAASIFTTKVKRVRKQSCGHQFHVFRQSSCVTSADVT